MKTLKLMDRELNGSQINFESVIDNSHVFSTCESEQ